MKIIKTTLDSVDENIINEAINVLADGGIVLYPTDTVYGLGANIFDKGAVRRVFDIKQRNLLKPLSILVSNVDSIDLVAKVSLSQKEIINSYLPGPYTFILQKKPIVPHAVTSGSNYVGVRVPDNEIACRLAGIFPITTTSANLSDEDVLSNPSEILTQLGRDVDLVIDVGDLKSNHPSKIIDLSMRNPKIIRK
ncbi:MAG: threonylcarbamoyl-AMP synthase [Methanobrevibacter sp.]|uniref:L-threonylcarbamoyladenylate synthase n=1 Tax=Methanobrevibacter sp. TaxID=66852 RepID=UPI0025E521D2|nr:L-threonylcarbamoyladenylate synthase [Methanobrevibacter sp.]MBR3112226.1 threonylcarbamoyl-AMP synthase [Methanobrevibacter sp.]MBR6994201.1 threonylcarbamoyl-AMP synthase [Methanobrevibacter sp.]